VSARRRDDPSTALRGFVNIDKPAGITSFDVVRAVRSAAGMRRVGHAGTLDPAATGVLPVALGEATKLVEELMDAHKRYRAVIEFGSTTDTYDAEGAVVARGDASAVTRAQLDAALPPFRGEQWQRPPAYSAVKRGGVPAYKAARAGTPLELEPRRVVTYAVELVGFERAADGGPLATVEVECGRGYYLRTLAHDLGEALGCGAHLRELRRTAVGPFRVEEAVPLARAEQRLAARDVETLVHASDAVLSGWPALLVGDGAARELRLGRDLPARRRWPHRVAPEGRRARCYGPDGRLIALLVATAIPDVWHPYRVLPADPAGATNSAKKALETAAEVIDI
jgi:tRNA pseudouridine55 synthase